MNLKALYTISYGLYVIGSGKADRFNSQIANTVCQITAEPPTIAVSINRKNLTHEFIQASQVFTASVLCRDTPLSFIGHFGFKSGRDIDKLEGINYKVGVTGAPVVMDNAAAYLETRVIQAMDVGTHTIFIGELIAAEVITDKEPLTYAYYQQVKRGSTPKTAPSYIEEDKKVSAVKAAKYKCSVCGYIYDPALGDPDGKIKPGTPFEELPEGWTCPMCGAAKNEFEKVN